MKVFGIALIVICSVPVDLSAGQSQGIVELMEESIRDDAAKKERDSFRTDEERRAIKEFAAESRRLDGRFSELWSAIYTNRRLFDDLQVAPLTSKLEAYEQQLNELLRARQALEMRMAKEQLDERDCWPDHDFTYSNYVDSSRKELRALTALGASAKAMKERNHEKVKPQLDRRVSSCRSIIDTHTERLSRTPISRLGINELDELTEDLQSFCSTMRDVDQIVEAIDMPYSEICPDRDEMVKTENSLESAWLAEVRRRIASGPPNEVGDSTSMSFALHPWMKPSSPSSDAGALSPLVGQTPTSSATSAVDTIPVAVTEAQMFYFSTLVLGAIVISLLFIRKNSSKGSATDYIFALRVILGASLVAFTLLAIYRYAVKDESGFVQDSWTWPAVLAVGMLLANVAELSLRKESP